MNEAVRIGADTADGLEGLGHRRGLARRRRQGTEVDGVAPVVLGVAGVAPAAGRGDLNRADLLDQFPDHGDGFGLEAAQSFDLRLEGDFVERGVRSRKHRHSDREDHGHHNTTHY